MKVETDERRYKGLLRDVGYGLGVTLLRLTDTTDLNVNLGPREENDCLFNYRDISSGYFYNLTVPQCGYPECNRPAATCHDRRDLTDVT